MYATIDDLNARRATPVPKSEEGRAKSLLGDASALIAGEFQRRGKTTDFDRMGAVMQANVIAVCCSMVNRAIKSADYLGVSQDSRTVGPYQHTHSFGASIADGNQLYMSKAEKRRLGFGGSRAGSIHAAIRR